MSRVLVIILLLPALLFSQDATFVAEVGSSTVPAGQQFQVSFVFGATGGAPENFKPPDFGQFVVISGPNTSQSFKFVNGVSSASVTYGYVLYARQEGKYTIGSATVLHRGKTLSTSAVTVTVTKAASPSQTQGQQQSGTSVQIGDNIVLKAQADRARVRLGEQVTVTWKIYTRVGMSISRISKIPTFDGFWGEDFDIPQQPALVNETLNGKQYRSALLKKTALFPSQTGRLTISPMEIACAVQVQSQRRSNDPFDQFFNDPFFQRFQSVDMDVASDPITITVDPFPPGAPEGFTNAVGSFTFLSSVDKKEVRAGDAVTLTVKVQGTGNIKLVTLPKPRVPTDIEVFDPTLSEDIKRDGETVRGSKTAEYVLVPRNEGQRTIEPMVFTYYDPEKRVYRTLRSSSFPLSILPGRELAMGVAGGSRSDVSLLGDDIRYISLDPGDPAPSGHRDIFGTEFFLFFLTPPLAFMGALIYRKRMEKVYGDLPSLRYERAGKEASKRLKAAKTLLSQGNAEHYNAEIVRALSGYLEHKLRIPKSTLGMDEVLGRLTHHGVTPETLERVRACVERAEYARYAPGGDTAEARKDLLQLADGVIRAIDKEFTSR